MNRDKQIEEMAKAINVADHEYCNGKCLGCEHKSMRIEDCACVDMAIAKGLVNAGYRKSTDVAREIFEEADKIFMATCLSLETYNAWCELKNKYTEEVK